MFGIDEWMAGLSDGASLAVVLLVARCSSACGTRPTPTTSPPSRRSSPPGRERSTRGSGAARRVVGARPRGDARRLRRADPRRRAVPPRERAARGGDRRRRTDRVPRRSPARPLAPRRVRPRRMPTGTTTAIPSGRRTARSASGSSTGWAGAPASASCSSLRSRRGRVAVAALLVLALFTAVSMTIVTTGFGAALGARGTRTLVAAAPALGRREPRVRRVVRRRRLEPRAVSRSVAARAQPPFVDARRHEPGYSTRWRSSGQVRERDLRVLSFAIGLSALGDFVALVALALAAKNMAGGEMGARRRGRGALHLPVGAARRLRRARRAARRPCRDPDRCSSSSRWRRRALRSRWRSSTRSPRCSCSLCCSGQASRSRRRPSSRSSRRSPGARSLQATNSNVETRQDDRLHDRPAVRQPARRGRRDVHGDAHRRGVVRRRRPRRACRWQSGEPPSTTRTRSVAHGTGSGSCSPTASSR